MAKNNKKKSKIVPVIPVLPLYYPGFLGILGTPVFLNWPLATLFFLQRNQLKHNSCNLTMQGMGLWWTKVCSTLNRGGGQNGKSKCTPWN